MKDNQLIFLISLPRSGSTLLQKMLGTHAKIVTKSEPWLMLHPLSIFRENALISDYDHELAQKGVVDFLSDASNSGSSAKKKYFDELREPFLKLYSDQLTGADDVKFLDKTPRYYLIFDELRSIFPEAKFILLRRNPLAVLSSILSTWVGSDIEKLYGYRGDLVDGAEFMLKDFSTLDNVYQLTYEDLVSNPEAEIISLQQFLEVEKDLGCINYDNSKTWIYGDQKTVNSKTRPDISHADLWMDKLTDPVQHALLSEYLDYLAVDRVNRMGYSFSDLTQVLSSRNSSSEEAERGKVVLENNHLDFRALLESKGTGLQNNRETVAALRKVRLLSNELDSAKGLIGQYRKEIRSKSKELNSTRSLLRSEMNSLSKQTENIKVMLKNSRDALKSSQNECAHLRNVLGGLRERLKKEP